MALYSETELDLKAKATVFSLDRNLESSNIAKEISALYLNFCESSKAGKLSIKPRQITEGVELRLVFEALCFATFIVSKIIPKYISTKKLIKKKIDYGLVRYYNARLARHLLQLCQDLGMTKLREIVIISPPPETKIKYGDPLYPIARLKKYSDSYSKKRGTEAQHFGRELSKALDPYHYPALEGLWQERVTALTKLAEKALAEIFKPNVKLKG